MWDLTYALTEEIGDPDLFVGRRKEMARLMDWAEGTKRRISKSMGILSRRKKGKTALLQRFFNVLFARNDPQLIPFYYRVHEDRLPKTAFAEELYRSLLTQYFAFTTRTPEWVDQILSLTELKELAQNARQIVLYLAAHEPGERGRDQILADLDIDMTDGDLEVRLHELVKADILAEGSSNFHYRGLGDRIFAMVFRRIYGVEIERVSAAKIEDDFKRQLDSARRQIARQEGQVAEYQVRYRLLAASLAGATLADIVAEPSPGWGAQEMLGATLDRFTTIRKAHFHLDLEHLVEIDLHAVSELRDGTDLMVEVKAWEREPTQDVVHRFVRVKASLAGHLERKTVFLFYSESGLGKEPAALLAEAGILILDPAKLARGGFPGVHGRATGGRMTPGAT